MNINTFVLPPVSLDRGFVDIREEDGNFLALYTDRGQGTWYSLDKMIGIQFVTMGNACHFNLYNNCMKLWVYEREILYCIRQLMRYMEFPPTYIQQRHPRYIRRFIRKYFKPFTITQFGSYGYKPRYDADVIVPGTLIVSQICTNDH